MHRERSTTHTGDTGLTDTLNGVLFCAGKRIKRFHKSFGRFLACLNCDTKCVRITCNEMRFYFFYGTGDRSMYRRRHKLVRFRYFLTSYNRIANLYQRSIRSTALGNRNPHHLCRRHDSQDFGFCGNRFPLGRMTPPFK